MTTLLTTDLPFPAFRRGKVRDVYDLGSRLLLVATDRISAFDCIMPEGIPDKGRILTQVANFWFEATRGILPNHLDATEVEAFPAELKPPARGPAQRRPAARADLHPVHQGRGRPRREHRLHDHGGPHRP